ncbi:EAL domain-containing protein [Mycolicibacterium sp. F2034L]|uniref:two-component system response regulator n=1 Tax=Mycolicibacterium sp. F2034L TaxID=2926422 RepID=UPI001FF2AB2B|nr:EAL domain-containing protein [Mycolicibacterium sp. F2034L]MCK0176934.1 EAL domain-containing protein [Mycolicibacterium sp. F2034L]
MLVPEAAHEEPVNTRPDQIVLVVDDDARLRDLLSTVLTPLKCEILQAASGEEALTLLLQRRVTVVVLDVNMPGMNGFETAQLIREAEETASTPIIFLTGQADAGDLGRGYDLGAVDYLVKPVSRQVLYAKVKALLELDESFARLRAEATKLHEQQLQAARSAEIRQREELAVTRRRERLTNIFAEASIDVSSLEKAIVGELSQMFDADCILRLPAADGAWHDSSAQSASGGAPEALRSWLAANPVGTGGSGAASAPHEAVLVEELTARGERVGVLCIGRVSGPPFTETERALFGGVSVAAALAISNATLWRVQAEYAAVMQATGDAILAVDAAGRIRSSNKAATTLFCDDCDTLMGRSIVDLAVDADRQRLGDELSATLASHQEVSREMTLLSGDGRPVDVMITLSPIGDALDLHVAVVVHDLTEIKHAQTEIRHLATHDPLTDLANRRQLTERLAALAERGRNSNSLVALLYADVNRFKAVNDTYGHDTGDELLIEIATRMRAALRDDTLVCRVGGDEFVIVLENVASSGAAVTTGNRILQEVQTRPVHCRDVTLQPSLSMGVACLGVGARTPEDLLAQADIAMFEAKKHRSGDCVLYTDVIGTRHQGSTNLRSALADAIARSEFRMVYQPIVHSSTGALVALEALIRWRVGDDEIAANEIIALAEAAGHGTALGQWILTRSFADYAALGRDDVRLHVNLAPDQLVATGFLDHLDGARREHDLAAENICLELAERAFTADPAPAYTTLHRAHEIGFQLAIDDFGVEYASMTNLMHVPVDWLKIDRSFIAQVHANERVQRLVRSQVAVAEYMQADLIAEGVETPAQAQWLRDAGCVVQQGFLYARPIEITELSAFTGPERRFGPTSELAEAEVT